MPVELIRCYLWERFLIGPLAFIRRLFRPHSPMNYYSLRFLRAASIALVFATLGLRAQELRWDLSSIAVDSPGVVVALPASVTLSPPAVLSGKGYVSSPLGGLAVGAETNTLGVRIDSLDQGNRVVRVRVKLRMPSTRGGNWQLALGYAGGQAIQTVVHVERESRITLRLKPPGPEVAYRESKGVLNLALGASGFVELRLDTLVGEVAVVEEDGRVVCSVQEPRLFRSAADTFVPLREARFSAFDLAKRNPAGPDALILQAFEVLATSSSPLAPPAR